MRLINSTTQETDTITFAQIELGEVVQHVSGDSLSPGTLYLKTSGMESDRLINVSNGFTSNSGRISAATRFKRLPKLKIELEQDL
jgi:hypothetical protein